MCIYVFFIVIHDISYHKFVNLMYVAKLNALHAETHK